MSWPTALLLIIANVVAACMAAVWFGLLAAVPFWIAGFFLGAEFGRALYRTTAS